MNIFILDRTPLLCAMYHADIHVGKMAIEASQLLSNAHTFYGSRRQGLCLPSHTHHPCSIWAHQSRANYLWLFELYCALHVEFMHRFKKSHGNYFRLNALRTPPALLYGDAMTPFALAMPDKFKVRDDAVTSYRNYYRDGKLHLHKWTNRDQPDWIEQ